MLRISHNHPCAFTLIEVLIATIIMALGLLGLSALFAGSAVQQQRSTQITDSVIFKGNIESILRSRISGMTLDPTSSKSMKWDVLVSQSFDGKEQLLGKTSQTGLNVVLEAQPVIGKPLLLNGKEIQVPLATPGLPAEFVSNLSNNLEKIRVEIVPSSLRITVDYETTDKTSGFPIDNTTTFRPGDVIGQPAFYLFTDDVAPSFVDPISGEPLLIVGGLPDPDVTYIQVTTKDGETSFDSLQVGTFFGGEQAIIKGFSITYKAIIQSLVSLNNRLRYVADEKVPGGRRPVLGTSLLGRVSTNGKNIEIIAMMYSLKPTAALRNNADDLPFIPPDTADVLSTGDGILREIAVVLAFEFTTGRYYITVVDSDDEIFLFEGQLVVMSSQEGVQSTTPKDYGANEDSRIARVQTRQDTSGNEQTRAYFNSGEDPRIVHGSPLPGFTGTQIIHVWVVVPTVESLTPDKATWIVEPREASLLKFPIEN